MNREQQEMALWRRVFERWYARDTCYVDTSGNIADAAVAEFRKRYPQQPAADDKSDNAVATTLITLLDDIAGDSAFSGFGQSMQSRIYAVIEAMRKGLPAAPAPVWYDEPPFAKDGESHPCWVDGCVAHGDVHWDDGRWQVWIVGSAYQRPLAGRRVCPIIKPQEPTT